MDNETNIPNEEQTGRLQQPAVMGRSFFRPKTRGDLFEALKRGEVCEVAGHSEEITSICLVFWLKFDSFKVSESPNSGWVLYEPF